MTVFVENFVLEDAFLSTNSNFMEIREKLNSFQDGKDKTDKIDLIICLGEDEILLRANLLFQVISKLLFQHKLYYCLMKCFFPAIHTTNYGFPLRLLGFSYTFKC